MQFFGLACVVALIPPAHWGWRLTTEKRLDRIRNKLILWVVGSALAAGCASLLPIPASWPLPTGLGGVIGDAVLWAPRRLLAGWPLGQAAFGLALAAGAILSLTAAAGYHLKPRGRAPKPGRRPTPPRCGASPSATTATTRTATASRVSASSRSAPSSIPR